MRGSKSMANESNFTSITSIEFVEKEIKGSTKRVAKLFALFTNKAPELDR